MPNVAVIVGNIEYRSLETLDCCAADLAAIKDLLAATEKYETIEIIENADANDLKARIRATVENVKSPTELFFYYTGHGYSYEGEFFYCATNFDSSRPNETGLSTTDLHTLLRLANSDLVIKVVDACNSGTHLVKAEIGLTLQNKQGFKNFIQISSCLDTQSSLAGNPLSLFTQKFHNAALSKDQGVIYYTDVIAALRDQFIGNEAQTPFFVSQYTGREQFVDDAQKLNTLREAIKRREAAAGTTVIVSEISSPPASRTLSELLSSVEGKIATPEVMDAFVAKLFESLKNKLTKASFEEFFKLEFAEHNDFKEPTAERFIIKILSREKRADNFVTAEISRKRRRANPLLGTAAMAFANLYDDEYIEMFDLELNCRMSRTQLRVTLTPRFSTLQRIVLVITCAPSLEYCYVFEVSTRHFLRDFERYDSDGANVVQRWYKFAWQDCTAGLVTKILDTLSETVRSHIDDTAKRLQ